MGTLRRFAPYQFLLDVLLSADRTANEHHFVFSQSPCLVSKDEVDLMQRMIAGRKSGWQQRGMRVKVTSNGAASGSAREYRQEGGFQLLGICGSAGPGER